MSETRKGDWIQCASGKRFWPLDPRPEDIVPEDIAHALAHLCRFNGHSRSFYSVAQHSIEVSLACPACPLHALLHDAAEAFVADLSRPVKKSLRALGVSIFDHIEGRIMDCVWERFGLEIPDEANQIQAHIDAADLCLLATEARDFMSPLHPEWAAQLAGIRPLGRRLTGWYPQTARHAFLDRFAELESRRPQALQEPRGGIQTAGGSP